MLDSSAAVMGSSTGAILAVHAGQEAPDRVGCMAPRSGVAVVGSISADLTVFASALPRPGETVIGETFSMVLGGKGANQALAAVRAGAPTFMIGAVGNDHFGQLTLETLRADGVDTAGVLELDGATGIAHIRVDVASGENDIVIVPEANHRLEPDAVEHALRELGDRISVVLVQLETPLRWCIGSPRCATPSICG